LIDHLVDEVSRREEDVILSSRIDNGVGRRGYAPGTANLSLAGSVSEVFVTRTAGPNRPEHHMTLLQKLFSRKPQPGQRVHVCIECGMPVADHKDWCSILRTRQEYERKAASAPDQS
jgi:hypothetical protein